MSLYIDKYNPKSFDEILFNKDAVEKLKNISQFNNISHILITGCVGSGRNTLANLYLDYKYKKKIIKHTNIVEIKIKNSKKKEIRVIYSNYHIQLNPSKYGVHDRAIIKEYVNDIIKKHTIAGNYITVIIEDADKLTIDAQESLRRTLEKYFETCRFIFLADKSYKMIDPLISRFLELKINLPTHDVIKHIISNINNIESTENKINFYKANDDQIESIVNLCDLNIKKAKNMLNLFNLTNEIVCDEKQKINNIIDIMTNNFNIRNILDIRSIIYDMLVHCIDPQDIIHMLFDELNKRISIGNEQYKVLIENFKNCSDGLLQCNKPLYYIEEFIINILLITF